MFFFFNDLRMHKPNHRKKQEKPEKHQLARLCGAVAFGKNPKKPGKTGRDERRGVGFSRFTTTIGCPQTRMKPCFSSFSGFSTCLRACVSAHLASVADGTPGQAEGTSRSDPVRVIRAALSGCFACFLKGLFCAD